MHAQSFAARERLCETHYIPPCINGDGFGIGWYSADIAEDAEPCIYRSTRPVCAHVSLSLIYRS